MSLATMVVIFIAGVVTTEISWYCFSFALRITIKQTKLLVVR
jgi:hypothetical protein